MIVVVVAYLFLYARLLFLADLVEEGPSQSMA